MSSETFALKPQVPVWERRAAVLSVFDLDSLTAVATLDEGAQAELAGFLDSSCEQVIDASGAPRWQLREAERARVLRDTPRSELKAALESVPVRTRPGDAVQSALTRYCTGLPAQLEELDAAGLRAELQLDRWTGGLAEDSGESAEDIRARLDWLAVTEPLLRLSAQGFVGRLGPLAELRSFIQEDSGPKDRGARDAAFLIEGVGGVGKSSLLAQLIPGRPQPDFLVAYLSFDRGWLIDPSGWSLLDEILRQIGAQLPASWRERRERVAALRRRAREAPAGGTAFRQPASHEAQSAGAVDRSVIASLSYLLRDLAGRDARLVVMLDTLEEVARRDDAVGIGIFRFLRDLHGEVPTIRVVGAGRVLPRAALETSRVKRLAGLEPSEALALLERLTADADVSAATLREVISLVGGNPLSLRLAADVLNRTGRDPAQLLAVAESNVQGQLYARLLDHIRDPRVRAVAHPGLVVRRITPEIIREVLAAPCGIAPLSEAEAAEIFRGLRQEATLCEDSPDGDEALIHRGDVRAIMLPAIKRDRPATTRAIQKAAVRHYAASRAEDDPVALRELIYHTLMLDDWDDLDPIWNPAAGADIATVIGELPPRGQLYVTSKIQGLRLDPEIRAAADDDQWRAAVRPRALSLMAEDHAEEALYLLRERRSPDGQALLPDIEVEALERLGRVNEATDLAETAREEAESHSDVDAVRRLITAQARLREIQGELERARDLWQSLAELDRARRDRTLALDDEVRVRELIALTSLLRIARRESRPPGELAALRAETAGLAEQTPERILVGAPSLLRDLAAEIGKDSRAILTLAVRVLGLPGDGDPAEGLPPPLDGPALNRIINSYQAASDMVVTDSLDAQGGYFAAGRDMRVTAFQANRFEAGRDVYVTAFQANRFEAGRDVYVTDSRVNYIAAGRDVHVFSYWPAVVGDIPQAAATFQPRKDLLAQLRHAGQGGATMYVVTGQPGAGKTQVAAAYARECVDAGWRLVGWVDAREPAAGIRGLARIARGLGIGEDGTDRAELARLLRERLETDGERRLLVLDNVTDLAALREFLPEGGGSQVVLTSTSELSLGMPVPVDVFTQAEALAYLTERTGRDDPRAAQRLASELGYLPLALAQAAAVMAAQHLTCDQFLERLRRLPLVDYLAPAAEDPYPRGLAEGVLLSLDAVTAGDPTRLCGGMMDLIALLSPDGVTRDLLYAAGATGQLSPAPGGHLARYDHATVTGTVIGAPAIKWVLAQLAGASLLSSLANGTKVAAHPLVARLIRERLARDEVLLATATAACGLLDVARARLGDAPAGLGDARPDRVAAQEWVQHVMVLAGHLGPGLESQDPDLMGELLELRGWALICLIDLGDNSTQAIEFGARLVDDGKRVMGPGHPGTLSATHNLALAHAAAGHADAAIRLLQETLARRRQLLGPDHPDTLRSQASLADAFQAAGAPEEAISLLRALLADYDRVLGPDHPDTLQARASLADAHESAGHADEAVLILQSTLADFERVLGPAHPETLRLKGRLASAYGTAGRVAEAISMHEANLEDYERVLGPSHPDTIRVRDALSAARQEP